MATSTLYQVERDGNAAIVTFKNNLTTIADSGQLQDLLQQLSDPGITLVLMDMSGVEYFGSIMLETFRDAWKCVSSHDGQFALCSVSEIGREILNISRFDTLWPIYPTRAEALRSLRAGN